ncbi:unnamed protein product [Auanema sp. JU1783]|nr:unnamed protein product [Auanema sp. JU1783]
MFRIQPLTAALRSAHTHSFKSRRTGKICGNCVLPRQSWRYDVALGKNFHKKIGQKIGFDMGFESKLILASLGQRQRKLDNKKMKQLSEIFAIKFEEVVSANEKIGNLHVRFGQIKVNSSFTELTIAWICNGKNDEEIQKVLDEEKFVLRKVLAESIGSNCPEIRFVPDRTELLLEEMNELFRKAKTDLA